MAEKIKEVGHRRAGQIFPALGSFFQRQIWPARLALLVAAFVVAILLGVAFLSHGSKLYRDWRQNRLLRLAASMLREEKFNEAAQTAREVVKLDLDSLPAYYILAEAAEKQNLEEAVSWRAQITRLLPKDPDSQLNLASAALRFGKLDLARKALDQVTPSDRDRAAFHVVAGWLARAEGNFAGQEEQFAAAVKKEPGNDLYQFNLAALQIQSNDPQKSTRARDTLDRLSKLAPFRSGALRALLNDAVARNDPTAADNFAQQLQMSQEVTFGDYLLCLSFYRKLDEKKFRLLLERVKPFAVRKQSNPSLDLARIASKWSLQKESEQLWLRVAKNPPMRREAFDALRRLYRANNNLEKLYDILQRLHESSPNEAPITADLARLGLNIDQNTKQSYDLAKQAYGRAPSELNCAVTYAFSLSRLGRSAEGLEIIQKLPIDRLHDPHAAVYVALLLLEANQIDAAKEYIGTTDDAKIYLEEKKLLDEARTKLATASATSSPPVSPASAEPTPTPTSTPSSTSTPPLL